MRVSQSDIFESTKVAMRFSRMNAGDYGIQQVWMLARNFAGEWMLTILITLLYDNAERYVCHCGKQAHC